MASTGRKKRPVKLAVQRSLGSLVCKFFDDISQCRPKHRKESQLEAKTQESPSFPQRLVDRTSFLQSISACTCLSGLPKQKNSCEDTLRRKAALFSPLCHRSQKWPSRFQPNPPNWSRTTSGPAVLLPGVLLSFWGSCLANAMRTNRGFRACETCLNSMVRTVWASAWLNSAHPKYHSEPVWVQTLRNLFWDYCHSL